LGGGVDGLLAEAGLPFDGIFLSHFGDVDTGTGGGACLGGLVGCCFGGVVCCLGGGDCLGGVVAFGGEVPFGGVVFGGEAPFGGDDCLGFCSCILSKESFTSESWSRTALIVEMPYLDNVGGEGRKVCFSGGAISIEFVAVLSRKVRLYTLNGQRDN
jgi:hypothetical protein